MSSTAHQSALKMKANAVILNWLCTELMTGDCKLTTISMAATMANCTAVALTERPTAFVSFQRQRASLPPI